MSTVLWVIAGVVLWGSFAWVLLATYLGGNDEGRKR